MPALYDWFRRNAHFVILICLNGNAVSSLYLYQTINKLVVSELPGGDRIGWMPITTVFLGYCFGNGAIAFGLVPSLFGSMHRHLLILVAALWSASLAPTMLSLAAASLFVGSGASVAQRLLGEAVRAAAPKKPGIAISSCIAAALLAVLGLRFWGEDLAMLIGWRTMFLFMSVGPALWVCFQWFVPTSLVPIQTAPEPSLTSLWLLTKSHVLRRCMTQQSMVFACYNAAWVLVAAQITPDQRGATVICAPLAGIVCILVGGYLVDLRGTLTLKRYGNLAVLFGGCPLILFACGLLSRSTSHHGIAVFGALPLGMALVDAGLQVILVSNQTEAQALDPASRGRLAALVTMSGSLGSALGGGSAYWLWQRSGWEAAVTVMAVTAAVGLITVYAPPALTHTKSDDDEQLALVSSSLRVVRTHVCTE